MLGDAHGENHVGALFFVGSRFVTVRMRVLVEPRGIGILDKKSAGDRTEIGSAVLARQKASG